MEKLPKGATLISWWIRQKRRPWFPAGLVEELEEVLGKRVDPVTSNGLYWLLRRRILKEARPCEERSSGLHGHIIECPAD